MRDVTYENASIDTAPAAGGYYTTAVSGLEKHGVLYMSMRGTWAGTVTLQFRPNSDTAWSAYATYTANDRRIIEDPTDCEWRIGVAFGGYTSGTIRLGIGYSRY